jgi:hypothetical protein
MLRGKSQPQETIDCVTPFIENVQNKLVYGGEK